LRKANLGENRTQSLLYKSIATDRFWPILVKKSRMVCASEKYASEIEIFTFGKGFRTRISRISVQKKAFSPVNDQAVWADRLFSTASAGCCLSR